MHININKTKKIINLLFLLIFFSGAITANAAVFGLSSRGIPNAGLNNGLVGWWTLDTRDVSSGADSSTYNYSRAITVDYTKVPNTDQTNFTVLVCGNGASPCNSSITGLNQSGVGAQVENASGFDIVFATDSDCSSLLNWEVENYVAATGELEAWVEIPSLSHTANTTFYMCYGNTSISSFQGGATGSAWDSNFIGVWHLNETATDEGTVASLYQDSTTNDKDGTQSGPDDIASQIANGQDFDGTNDNISIGDYDAIDTATDLTGCAWVNHDIITGDDEIIAKDLPSGGVDGLLFKRDDIGSVSGRTDTYLIYLGDTGDANNARLEGATDASPTGTWTHVCFSAQLGSATGLRLYVNAIEDANSPVSTIDIGAINTGTNPLRLGSNSSVLNPFDGKIDEVRISSSIRSADWITTEYNNQSSPSTFYTIGEPVVISVGGVVDRSGNGKNGTATFNTQIVGKIGQALNFNGTTDYISIGNVSASAKTISFWMKADNNVSKKIIDIDGTKQIEINGSSNVVATSFPAATVYVDSSSASPAVENNKWHFVVVTDSTGVNASAMDIGRVSTGFFDGTIDDVRVYNKVLSDSEIRQLYNQGSGTKTGATVKSPPGSGLSSGLVGNWSFDGKDIVSGVMRDASGYNNNGNFFNISTSTFFVPGKIGQAGNFDGVNDYLTVSNHSSIQFDQTIPFSLSFWYKSTSKLTENSMIAFKTNGFEGWRVYISSSDSKVYFRIHTFDFSYTITSTGTVVDGDWHYITVTYSGNSNRTGMSVYVDALSPVVGTASNIGQTFLNSSTLYIGRTSGATERVKGYLDNVRLYNRALSESEIRQLYRLGAGAKIASTVRGIPSTGLNSGLVSWWTFDGKDISNGLILDKGTNGNHGRPISIASSTFYSIGKIGQGITLDQSNDYIDIGSNTVLTTGQPFSISWWEKITDNSRITDASADYPSRFNFDVSGSARNFLVIRARSNATYTPITFGNAPSVATFFAVKVLTAPSVSAGIGVWNHYVITGSDPNSSTASDFLFYHNGVSLTTSTGGPFGTVTGNRIGLDGGGDSAAGATLDDVRVYNRRLSAQEVMQLYRQGK